MNWWIWALALFFMCEQNLYFGSHLLPRSDAELIADGVNILLFALAFVGRRA